MAEQKHQDITTQPAKNVAVYCGASIGKNVRIRQFATDLGKALADNDYGLVFGAGNVGIMGTVSSAVRDNHGYVTAVIPDFLQRMEPPIEGIEELHIVDNMHTRKMKMYNRSQAFVIMPGGLGTLDEVFEILTWKILELHDKPVIFINIDNYYKHIFAHIEHMIEQEFCGVKTRTLFDVATTTDEVIEILHKI